MSLLRAVRSLFSVLSVGLYFVLGSLVLRLYVLPASWLRPDRRFQVISWFMRFMSRGILGLLTLGGARFRRHGTVPTGAPVLLVSNHQSLLDILQIALLSRPRVPAFVTRTRYTRFVPLVSASVRLLGSPMVDPRRDPRGAVEAIREGARRLPHGILIFPEGHRSSDGSILAFRRTGIETVLRERPVPVYLVLNEGLWQVRRLVDLLFRVHRIDAVSLASGPFDPPADPTALAGFVEDLRQKLVAQLARLREGAATEGE